MTCLIFLTYFYSFLSRYRLLVDAVISLSCLIDDVENLLNEPEYCWVLCTLDKSFLFPLKFELPLGSAVDIVLS